MYRNDKAKETDAWLGAVALASALGGFFPITAICGGTLLVRKTSKPIGNGVKAAGKEIGKGIGKGAYLTACATKRALTPKPKSVVSTPPTKTEHAQVASEKYEETCALIDAMPLDDDEKESMKIHAKRQLIKQMWSLLK